ncbi:hypothetical protein VDBG_07073 [Verticillium alfalfae VaMs.102]|uniref:Uncharacterized protein n=1 Tax=Verticillium alfalfae (strain VaMs.102 / ATCC MYA-4576 / FGSC 10136) TaxID=526221 RepID=C9SQ38_VERA1|nr:hypothetical protein VDBG_07073 [Verticillium alfalfae VaMs.102]EEY20963.1 hypothetical protein VDBG_07073 [Verticillium alfalfae VaMs.102]
MLDLENDLVSSEKHKGSGETFERSCAEEPQDDAILIAAHAQVRY